MRKNIIILDVETNNKQEVFDLSIIVGDLHGNIVEMKQWIIEELYEQELFWEEKRVDYDRVMADPTHPAKLTPVKQALKEYGEIIEKYNVKTIYAYNAAFDSRTTNNLAKRFDLPNPMDGIEIDCLWFWAAQTIFQQKRFQKWADKNWEYAMTEKGNYKTSAEICYAYMHNEPDFDEVHRGIEDCLIEYEIFLHCRKQKKLRVKGICQNAWILAQTDIQIEKLPAQFRTMKVNLDTQIEQSVKLITKLNKGLKVKVELA